MFTKPKGPIGLGGLDGDEAETGRVVTFAGRRAPVALGVEGADCAAGATAEIHQFALQFTLIDHAALAVWASDTSHGYDRLDVDQGLLEDGTWAKYALVYRPGQAWSIWGVRRRDDHVEVWRCATGKTVDRHALMADALASLPHAANHRRTPPNLGRRILANTVRGPTHPDSC